MKFKKLTTALLAGLIGMSAHAGFEQFNDGTGIPKGFMNVFQNVAAPGAGGAIGDYQFGSDWGVPDLQAIDTGVVPNRQFELLPNIGQYEFGASQVGIDTNDVVYWTDSIDGGLTAGLDGNKWMEATLLWEFPRLQTNSPTWNNCTFDFDLGAFDLDPRYDLKAFVKVLDPNSDWSVFVIQELDLSTLPTNSSYQISFPMDASMADMVLQAGFVMQGLNANPADDWGSSIVTATSLHVTDTDITAPLPDPMTFAVSPTGVSGYQMTMTATTAVDDSTADVEYLFENVTPGYGHQSGWQTDSTWNDVGVITPGSTTDVEQITNLNFDPVDDQWEGYDSVDTGISPTNFVTSALGVATVTPSAYSANEVNYFTSHFGLEGDCTFSLDAANITADGNPTIFVKEFDGGWGWIGGQFPALVAGANTITFTATAGNIYQVGVLANGSTSGSFDISNPSLIAPVVSPEAITTPLVPLTTYTYRVKARDASGNLNETDWSATADGDTLTPDSTAPTPDPMTFADAGDASPVSVLLNASVATDDSLTAVEYFFSNTVNDVTSGWQDSTQYLATGLTPDTPYSFTVRARDLSLNETAPSSELLISTTSEPASDALDESLTDLSGDTSDPLVLHGLAKGGLETGSVNANANIVFTSTGAVFSAGTDFTGRDILRTVAAGYSNLSFTAYGTYKFSGETDTAAYIGIGSGIITGESGSNWGVPELELAGANGMVGEFKDGTAGGSPVSSVLKILDGGELARTTGGPTMGGTEQFRAEFVYNAVSNTVRLACHRAYVLGDPYVETDLVGEIDTLSGGISILKVGAPVKVYFGGGHGTLVRDIQIIPDTVAPLVPVAGLVISSAGQLQWDSVVGQVYSVEYKNDLVTDPTWTVDPGNTDLPGTGSPISTTPIIPGNEVFYQISTDYAP